MHRRDPYHEWLGSLTALTSTSEAAQRWREARFSFAFRLGEELVARNVSGPSSTGNVVYGIWLSWGSLYIGQTTDASRRLRDLPVGESHHLANTFPPEIWDRVVIVDWGSLPEAGEAIEQRGHPEVVGKAIEHRLQARWKPLVNGSRRTSAGGWRSFVWENSRSVGALHASSLGELGDHVDRLWDRAAGWQEGDPPLSSSARCVRPSSLF